MSVFLFHRKHGLSPRKTATNSIINKLL